MKINPISLTLFILLVIVIVGGLGVYWGLSRENVRTENISDVNTEREAQLASDSLEELSVSSEEGIDDRGFFSPSLDDSYSLGSKILIKWDPKLIDASTMYLVCTGLDCPFAAMQIYLRLDSSDPVSIQGEYNYNIPISNIIPSGTYKIAIYSYQRQNVISSHEFSITSPMDEVVKKGGSYSISRISGAKASYTPGEKIILTIETLESDATPASKQKGFNIQAHIFDANDYPGPSYQVANAQYDSAFGKWFLNMTAPSDTFKIYKLKISLYCGLVNSESYCYQNYRTFEGWDEELSFTVSDS